MTYFNFERINDDRNLRRSFYLSSNPNLSGFLGIRLEVGQGGLKVPLPLCLELVRIMLVETLTFGF